MDAAAVRRKLGARLEELGVRDAALTRHLRGEDGRNSQDFADRVAFTEMDEVIEQLDDSARQEMLDIRYALERLASGDYGTCESCGETIPERRLEVVPHARLCVGCQD
ncbi:MAG: TraR/DksA family transcriptional regulator [Myxococcota bacterium]